MQLSMEQWYFRYSQQATWTKSIREKLFHQAGLNSTTKILDVGCGPGVLLNELNVLGIHSIHGLDIAHKALSYAKLVHPLNLAQGNALRLPYDEQSFDIVFCHFLLLWIKDPSQVIAEMIRVTRPRGFVLALAEPDYGGRIDFPKSMEKLGDWQMDALIEQGANPILGRELRYLFANSGLTNVEVGVLGGQWSETSYNDSDLEWEVIRSDLGDNQEFLNKSSELHKIDREAIKAHQRILYIPTFYAIGKKF